MSDDASRALAGNDSGTISGVKTVVNNLTVQPADSRPPRRNPHTLQPLTPRRSAPTPAAGSRDR